MFVCQGCTCRMHGECIPKQLRGLCYRDWLCPWCLRHPHAVVAIFGHRPRPPEADATVKVRSSRRLATCGTASARARALMPIATPDAWMRRTLVGRPGVEGRRERVPGGV